MSFLKDIRFSTYKCIVDNKRELNSEQSLLNYINYIKDLNTKNILANFKSDLSEIKKSKLKVYLLSGLFSGRANDDCIVYSKLIVQDIDKVENIDEVKQRIINDSELKPLIVHKSASGKGPRAFYYIDITKNQHSEVYETISKYLLLKHSIISDKSCKNIARLWCISYDSDIYIKENLFLTEAYQKSHIDNLVKKYSLNYDNNHLDLFEEKIEEMFKERVREGRKHNELLRISCYAGAWVNKNYVSYHEAENFLINMIQQTPNIININSAIKTIKDGLNYGIKYFLDFNIKSPQSNIT